jgi:heme/copper-type cytochrome/quinol oxidase subunit 1
MPRVSQWLIRAALLQLLSGAMLGAVYLVFKAEGWFPTIVTHLGTHQEQMLVGWMVQLVIGVAYWILPRPAEQAVYTSTGVMWLVFWLLNAGVLVASLGTDPLLPAWLLLVGRLAETLAVVLFARHAWHRQRAYRAGVRTVLV